MAATPAPTRAPRPAGVSSQARAAVARLASIELNETPDAFAYAALMRAIALELSLEADMTAHELQRKLERGAMGLVDRVQAKMAARRVARRMRMVAQTFHQAADETARFWMEYSRVYADLIQPPPEAKRDSWQFAPKGGRRTS